MSVLERYLNTEKYQGVMRELAIAQILNEKSKPGLFIKANALDRCGWMGEESDFPNAEADYEHVFNTGDTERGWFFKSPRMLIIHGGGIKDTTFIENSANKGEIVGIYPKTRTSMTIGLKKIPTNRVPTSVGVWCWSTWSMTRVSLHTRNR